MTVKHQQSTAITNRQAVPVVPNPTGAGAEGYMKTVDGYVTVAASQAWTARSASAKCPATPRSRAS
jgi:predicted phage tail protein